MLSFHVNSWGLPKMHTGLRGFLLTGAAVMALSSTAIAAPKDDTKARIDALQQSVVNLNAQLQQLKSDQAQSAANGDSSAALTDLKRSTSDQYVDLSSQIAAATTGQNKASVDNGRLQIASADGRFSAALRVTAQVDNGIYSQSHAATLLPAVYGPDLGSGANFRRMYFGLQGKVFGDWSYNINFDFGGSGGTETPGHVQSVYIEYDGLAPWVFRIGAFPPPANLEDGTASGETIFLERNSPSDLQRNLAGGDGRDAISILYTSQTVFGALSYTGNKIGDGAKALAAAGATTAPNFDEQQALVGRLSWLPISTSDVHWLVGVNGTYGIKPPDATVNGAADLSTTPGGTARNSIALSDPPEITVDSNGIALTSTGALPASHLTQWGIETAGNWGSFYGQAGYYGINVTRTPVALTQFTAPSVSNTAIVKPSNDNFSAWYVQGSWILTGESRGYNVVTGAFTPPKVAHPFSFGDKGGIGAWELALRYSDTNLNDHINDPANIVTAASGTSRTFDFYNTVRGGDQRIVTAGINWYTNNAVRFALDYQLIQASRLQSGTSPNPLTGITATGTALTAPAIPGVNGGQNLSTITLRAQLSL
jgi:phosphate-selective porin OprO/OprP